MARKDHTQVADRVRGNALGMFHDAYGELQRANEILNAGIEADAAHRDEVNARLALAAQQLTANKRVADKLKDLLS